jgi:pimeloyl-ACP methyl ester carboxylesterase
VRVHLLGHSFGARVVAYALAGLPADGGPSPVKTVFLLQGAFSHFTFAASLPQDPARSGGLAGMQTRVDGPLLVSHSVHDLAVGQLYPLASMASQDDAAAFGDALYRWGAMGHDGAQTVQAADCVLGPVSQAYPFAPGAVVNLNGDNVITVGSPPGGAHGDINHPQLAWATLAAAGICAAGEAAGAQP